MLTGFQSFAQTVKNCTSGCDINLPTVSANNNTLQSVLQILFGVLGILAVIYLLYAAIEFITSQGEPQKVAKARDSIVYALIGLLVAVSAELIVTFVLGKI